MALVVEPLPVARWLRTGGEGLLIALVTLSAWPFASVYPYVEYLLTVGVALLAAFWTAHAAVTRRFTFRLDLVSGALAGLILLTAFQLVPLPLAVVKVISPARAEWHETFLPEQLERLPGEADLARSNFVPLSVNPHDTATLVARLIALFAVYAAARYWLADRDTLRRFAWAATLNGVLLALVGLGQFFSSPPGEVFWTFDVDAAVFGPFICRNHYPDYLAFGIGGAMYLLHPSRKERAPTGRSWRERLMGLLDIFDRPVSLCAALALGLMLASVPFSQSRGGVAAVAVAGVGVAILAGWGKRAGGQVGMALGVAAAVGVGLVLWLGIGPITERFRNDGQALDDRLPLWSAAAKPLPGIWAVGSGGGTFQLVEPLGRTTQPTEVVCEHAHNEYLEAAVEGGAARLALTLLLAVGVPVVLGRMYRRLRGRSVGAFVLGVWFAVVVLVVHSAVDFAVHLPAVAVMAAAVVGLAMGCRSDLTPRPPLRSGEGVFNGDAESTFSHSPTDGESQYGSRIDPPLSASERGTGGEVKPLAFLFPLLLTLTVIVAALDARSRWRADQLRIAADETTDTATRVELLSRRTRVAPADPNAWFALAQEHLRAGDRTAALAAFRTARGLCPLHPDAQFHLGLHARQFERAEPPVVYFRRTTRILPTDPDVWFACGVEELNSGDRPAAEVSWRRSLELSPKRLKAILQASESLPAEAIRDRLLADDPTVLMQAAAERPASERRVYVEAAAKAASRADLPVSQVYAVAEACDELGRFDDAMAVWHRSTAAHPSSGFVRGGAAMWFEQRELYIEAVPHLEWLADRSPADLAIRDRLAAARHGAELKRVIGK